MFSLVSSADAALLPVSVQVVQEGGSCNLKEVSTSEVPVWLLNHSKQHDNSEQPLATIFVSGVRLQNLKNYLVFWEGEEVVTNIIHHLALFCSSCWCSIILMGLYVQMLVPVSPLSEAVPSLHWDLFLHVTPLLTWSNLI